MNYTTEPMQTMQGKIIRDAAGVAVGRVFRLESDGLWYAKVGCLMVGSGMSGEEEAIARFHAALTEMGGNAYPQRPSSTCLETAYGTTTRLSFQIKVF